jgi:hypothetical protein
MVGYLRFTSGEGGAADVLLEVDTAESLPAAGEENAGLGRWARGQGGAAVATAQSAFKEAVRQVVSVNVAGFLAAVDSLERPPDELEVTFGLKATGEVGNLAVGKVAAESNYEVRMLWKRPGEGQRAPGGSGAA